MLCTWCQQVVMVSSSQIWDMWIIFLNSKTLLFFTIQDYKNNTTQVSQDRDLPDTLNPSLLALISSRTSPARRRRPDWGGADTDAPAAPGEIHPEEDQHQKKQLEQTGCRAICWRPALTSWFTNIFNLSLQRAAATACFKATTIVRAGPTQIGATFALSTPLCSWIVGFLTIRPQNVFIVKSTVAIQWQYKTLYSIRC